jgi:hypothetical protein
MEKESVSDEGITIEEHYARLKKKLVVHSDLIKIESIFEYLEWALKLPYIKWPAHYLIKALPPFLGAMVRYFVAKEGDEENHVSIYLDCHDLLGCYGSPYWEVMGMKTKDPARCDWDNINGEDGLLALVREAFGE